MKQESYDWKSDILHGLYQKLSNMSADTLLDKRIFLKCDAH